MKPQSYKGFKQVTINNSQTLASNLKPPVSNFEPPHNKQPIEIINCKKSIKNENKKHQITNNKIQNEKHITNTNISKMINKNNKEIRMIKQKAM